MNKYEHDELAFFPTKLNKMETVTVFSPIRHKNSVHINDSEIWNRAFHREELGSVRGMYEYKIKFDGLKPIQLTKTTKH